jgi:two-component system sensor histidine kinase/response regulator
MLTICEKCRKQYQINPSDIKDQSARFKCRECGEIITVSKPSDALEKETTPDFQDSEQSNAFLSSDFESDFSTQDFGSSTSSDSNETPASETASSISPPDSKLEIQGMSLKSKITLIMALLVFFPLAIVGSISTYKSHEALSKQAESHLVQIAAQKSNEYDQIFNRIEEELHGMAAYAISTLEQDNISKDIDIGFNKFLIVYGETGPAKEQELDLLEKEHEQDILKIKTIGPVLQSVVANNPYLSLGYLTTEKALTIFDKLDVVEQLRGVETFHPQKRPWYIAAKEKGETIWTDLYVDVATKKMTVTCATPVFTKDKTYKGVMGFDVLVDTIKNDILNLDIGYESYAFLVNKEGKVLVKPEIDKGSATWDSAVEAENLLTTKNVQFNNIVKNMINMKQGFQSYTSDEGERYIAYSPIKSMNVSMGIVVFKNEVVGPAKDMMKLIGIVMAVVLVIAILFGVLLGGAITKPINQLTMMADLMSQGQMDLDVLKETRTDEIGVLTKSFNRLIISLKMALSR